MTRITKYKLKSSSIYKITKKDGNKNNKKIYKKIYKKSYNKSYNKKYKNTNKYLKSKTFNSVRKHTQKGGLFDYFKNLYDMYKFNNLVKEMNKADSKIDKDFKDYKIQTNIIKNLADRIAEEVTKFIINYRRQQICYYLIRDTNNVHERDIKSFQNEFDNTLKKDKAIKKTMTQLNKGVQKEELPKYIKLTAIFEKNLKKFNEMLEKYTNLSPYRTKISVKQSKYAIMSTDAPSSSSKYKSDYKDYEKEKSKYEKHINLNDTYIETLNKKVKEIVLNKA